MQCPHCNQEHPEGALFCPVTGKKILIPLICPDCGRPVDPSWMHCSYCGRTLIQENGRSKKQEAQTTVSPQTPIITQGAPKNKTGSPIILLLMIIGGIFCLLIVTLIMYNNFWNSDNKGEAAPKAIAALPSTNTPDFATQTAEVFLTNTHSLPTFTLTSVVPHCPGMEIQSEQRTGGIFLLICAKNLRYEMGPLADGVFRVGPNNMFFIYITYYGEVYAARLGDDTLTHIDRIEFFNMILKNDEPKYEISFLGNHPYQLYVKEFFMYQDKTIPIPRYITTPNE
jgi:hypothetical protein